MSGFLRLLLGSLVMLIGGYVGETNEAYQNGGFIVGMAGWIYIIWEIFKGEASQLMKTVGMLLANKLSKPFV